MGQLGAVWRLWRSGSAAESVLAVGLFLLVLAPFLVKLMATRRHYRNPEVTAQSLR